MQFKQDSLGWLFTVVIRMHHNCMHTLLKERGLAEISHPRLLFMIDHAERQGHKLAQRELAESLAISPASIAVSLKRMEKSGLILRAAADDDNRRNEIKLTEKGHTLVEQCHTTAHDLEERTFAGFSAREQAELYGYFQRIIANMETLGVSAPRPIAELDPGQPCPNDWPG